jgi:CheY-like chemotaxis protein
MEAPAVPGAGFCEDDEFLAELRETFRAGLSGQLTLLRKTLQDLAVSSPGDPARQQLFSEMYRRVHSLTGGAGTVGINTVAQLGTPLEALLRELCEKPKHPTPSILRTLHQAGQLMAEILASGEERNWLDQSPVEILAVDDELISQRAIAYALKKAQLKCEILGELEAVGPWLATHRCDLIVVGADIPGMNLTDLAVQWRAAQPAPKTPVLHVVSPNDLDGRLRACPPGDDCLAKPFLFVEMSVKALTMILGQRMAWAGA